MESLNEEQLVSIEIDLEELKKNEMNESFLTMFGATIRILMQKMGFGKEKRIPFHLRGKRSDVNAFARTLGREKQYVTVSKKYGLQDPRTYQNKSKLDLAIKNFEAETGLTWPFK
tara:strand:- start:77 stop:421 length:345 start_codon:yes stop_codon:yes gene_type:complete